MTPIVLIVTAATLVVLGPNHYETTVECRAAATGIVAVMPSPVNAVCIDEIAGRVTFEIKRD